MKHETCVTCGADLPLNYAANLYPDGKRSCLGCERRLYLFKSGNPDSVVAFDEDDALRLWCEHIGEKPEDYADESDWRRMPDDETAKYWLDPDTGAITDDEGVLTELTAAEAVRRYGRGFLASVDF
jgi:hypothetical protein